MLVGQTLSRRQTLTSVSGAFVLAYQDDGNLVLYPYDQDRAVWASGTYGRSVGECVLQEDGNLVVYDREGRAVWATGTDGRPVIRLLVHDTGVLLLQDETGDVIWSTGAPPPTRSLTKVAAPLTPGRKGTPTRPASAGASRSRSVPAGRAVRRSDGEQGPSEG
jgi:outer membrane protein assembly factor BamB